MLGWLVGWLAGWLAGCSTNMRQKRVPLARTCVENANPLHENASKVRTLSPKLHPRDPDERQKCDPFIQKCVENVTPQAESRRPSFAGDKVHLSDGGVFRQQTL